MDDIEEKAFEAIIGLSIDEAKYLLKTHEDFSDHGYTIREIIRDGKGDIVTADFAFDRINVATVNGKITGILMEKWIFDVYRV